MQRPQRFTLVITILFFTIGCDQAAKYLAMNALKGSSPVSLFYGAVQFYYAENNAAFLSLGSHFSPTIRFWLFTVGMGVFLCLLTSYLIVGTRTSSLEHFGCALILGGGASNLIDRMTRNGQVIDFLNIGLGSFRSGIFNLADMVILTGLVFIYFSIPKLKPKSF